jgi:hypothetical protein
VCLNLCGSLLFLMAQLILLWGQLLLLLSLLFFPFLTSSALIQSWEYDLQTARQSNPHLVNCSSAAFVTFIMPSSGSRSSIKSSIRSLIEMASCEWRLIVVYSTIHAMGGDSLESYPPIHLSRYSQGFENDPRIFYLPYQRLSLFNYGGSSRNAAMKYVTTDWIAFLDDDDEVSSDYLTVCRREAELHPAISVMVFRMTCERCYEKILPPFPYPALVPDYVGGFHAFSFSLHLAYSTC